MLIEKDVNISDLRRGKVNLDILIYAVNAEEIVDHLQIETKASIFLPRKQA